LIEESPKLYWYCGLTTFQIGVFVVYGIWMCLFDCFLQVVRSIFGLRCALCCVLCGISICYWNSCLLLPTLYHSHNVRSGWSGMLYFPLIISIGESIVRCAILSHLLLDSWYNKVMLMALWERSKVQSKDINVYWTETQYGWFTSMTFMTHTFCSSYMRTWHPRLLGVVVWGYDEAHPSFVSQIEYDKKWSS
jgi:hypothetical protein